MLIASYICVSTFANICWTTILQNTVIFNFFGAKSKRYNELATVNRLFRIKNYYLRSIISFCVESWNEIWRDEYLAHVKFDISPLLESCFITLFACEYPAWLRGEEIWKLCKVCKHILGNSNATEFSFQIMQILQKSFFF